MSAFGNSWFLDRVVVTVHLRWSAANSIPSVSTRVYPWFFSGSVLAILAHLAVDFRVSGFGLDLRLLRILFSGFGVLGGSILGR
jgi:hypothetical protein